MDKVDVMTSRTSNPSQRKEKAMNPMAQKKENPVI